MPVALSIAPPNSFGQNDWDNVQHNFHVMLVPVSHDANIVINDTIPFLGSKWSKWDVTWPFSVMECHWHQHQHHVMPMQLLMEPLHLSSHDNCNLVEHDILVTWCMWCWHWHHVILIAFSMVQLHLLAQDDQNEVQHNFLSCDATGTVLASHYVTDIGLVVRWCHCHLCQHHVMQTALPMA